MNPNRLPRDLESSLAEGMKKWPHVLDLCRSIMHRLETELRSNSWTPARWKAMGPDAFVDKIRGYLEEELPKFPHDEVVSLCCQLLAPAIFKSLMEACEITEKEKKGPPPCK